MSDEEKLKRAFGALKAEDAKKAPSFRSIVDRGAPKKRSPWLVVVPLASSAAIAAVFLVWCGTAQMAPSAAPTAANNKSTADESAAAGAMGGESAKNAAGGKKAVADGIAAASTDFRAAPDPAPLDFLLALPGSSALAEHERALALPVLR